MAAKKNGPPAAALTRFEAAFGKAFGEKSLKRTSNRKVSYDVISTGSIALDFATGVGGFPEGRLVELWGPEGTGKTTTAMLAMAQAQKKYPDKFAAVVDMEQTWDLNFAAKHGVDNDRVYLVQPETAEDVADAMKMLMETGFVKYILLDSIGAMIPKEEVEKNAGDATVGTTAKIVTRMVKIAAVNANKYGVTPVIINQVRDRISYGGGTTTGGGWALKHVTSLKLRFSRSHNDTYTIGKGEAVEQVGQLVSVKVEKNKVAPPGRIAKVSLFNQDSEEYGPVGVDRAFEAFSLGKRLGILSLSGAYYTLPDTTRHQGEGKTLDYLRAHPEAVEQIRTMALATVAHEVVDDGPLAIDLAAIDEDAPSENDAETTEESPDE